MALEIIAPVLFVFLVVFFLLFRKYKKKVDILTENMKELISKKQSLSTKYGKLTEQFMPFLEAYPYDEHNFRFIGTPIDGIQFEDDKIILIEFKASDSKLTVKQRKIKNLIKDHKIEFQEFRIS